jgi:TRAP-type C4-dicarboxylate transport system permease small subunit
MYEKVGRVFCVIGGGALLVMLSIACGNMILRVFGFPIKGSYELIGLLAVITYASALGEGERANVHLRADIISCRYKPEVRDSLNFIGSIIMAIFFFIVALKMLQWGFKVYASGEKTETLRLRYYPVILWAGLSLLWLVCSFFVNERFKTLFAKRK